jgi:cyclopropane-fatty-acyl-phospholipid synthase
LFEHLGLADLATVRRVLRPGGLFPNHGITHDAEGMKKTVGTGLTHRYVFADGEFDRISNIQVGIERAGFDIPAGE